MNSHICLAAGAVIALAGSASAGLITLDWETDGSGLALPAGSIIDETTYAPLGIEISTLDAAGDAFNAIIFDGANPTGNDSDLSFPQFGNILIIPENLDDDDNDGLVDDPNDEGSRPAGEISFDLDFLGSDFAMTFLDGEEASDVEFFLNGMLVGTAPILDAGNASIQTVSFDASSFDAFTVNFGGSGAIGDISFVPAPGAAALAGLAGLVGIRRRR